MDPIAMQVSFQDCSQDCSLDCAQLKDVLHDGLYTMCGKRRREACEELSGDIPSLYELFSKRAKGMSSSLGVVMPIPHDTLDISGAKRRVVQIDQKIKELCTIPTKINGFFLALIDTVKNLRIKELPNLFCLEVGLLDSLVQERRTYEAGAPDEEEYMWLKDCYELFVALDEKVLIPFAQKELLIKNLSLLLERDSELASKILERCMNPDPSECLMILDQSPGLLDDPRFIDLLRPDWEVPL